ncbi:MAG: acyltransferase [Candidatus Cloacimonetes bacterium]|nr:acyltransferase [Candidatus Cloacimonadota bacterium]
MDKKINYLASWRFIWRGLLGYVAYYSIFPSFLSPLIHRMRGTIIDDPFNVYIAPNVLIDSIYPEYIRIEKDVYLTRGAKIISHINPTKSLSSVLGFHTKKGHVHIKEGTFVGVGAIILPDVTIGECCIIGAGAVVTKSVPAYSLVGGNPAKVIKDLRCST